VSTTTDGFGNGPLSTDERQGARTLQLGGPSTVTNNITINNNNYHGPVNNLTLGENASRKRPLDDIRGYLQE
jgi:hypothetical protein